MEHEACRETRCAPRPTKLVLIRANGALFYSVASAALLEASAACGAERMAHYFAADDAFCDWIRTQWMPCKTARARALREYVEATWPEFDFSAALHEYSRAAEGDPGLGPQRPSAAHEALARCLAAAETALFYRSLARWAEDHRLRGIAAAFGEEEAPTLSRFRGVYEQHARSERLGLAGAWRAARALVRTTRDVQLPFAFTCLATHWRPNAPIAQMSYRDFLRRMRSMIRRHSQLGFAERVLFAGWGRRPRLRTQQRGSAAPAWFKPVLRPA
ncbi:MAG: hypothetical protein ACXW2I_00160 [Burkholderiales bacterium]